ncbi:probable E3 ubiquitin-protein ligase DTX2 isoform X1 [Bufo bufo]|uniref:probable E3 ubiquitin-protein ligase DTX2 isoform X1 n=2 Tax=Bufo bufo TaxID=8384 RepID=UPI001ABE7B9B|nr:probable E3 ubiquitin-protein ligase DTX2 isoform X1 [Bufo bufo]
MAAGPPQSGGAVGPSGPPTVTSQWNPASLAVAVWEWQDELGKWRPYSSKVSNYIEQCMQSYQQQKNARALGNSNSIALGQADPKLAAYIIDIATLAQFRQDTGTMRYVRKSLYSLNSAPAKGICWEWLNDDGRWTAYETQICMFLEENFSNGNPTVDLGIFGLCYHVDFLTLIQTNQVTGFRRQVQRRLDTPYPVTTKVGPAHKSSACACHQCLASSGAGPIPVRYRHSMINLSASSNYPNASRTSNSSTSYLPYPKPTITSAKSAPKLNNTWLPPSTSMQFPGPSSANGMQFPGPSSANRMQFPGPSSANGMQFPGPSSSANGMQFPGPSSANGMQFHGPPPPNGISMPSLPVQVAKNSSLKQALAGMTAILMSSAGLPVRLTSASAPANPHVASKRDKNSVRRLRKMPKKAGIPCGPEQVVKKYMENIQKPPEEDCIICMETLTSASGYSESSQCKNIKDTAVGKLKKCGHVFHQLCMLEMYNSGNKDGSLQCPACKTIYGEKTGTQPKGKMDIFLIPQSLPSNQDCGTIHLVYTINPGIQGPEHPNPGKQFTARGFPRHCYLPDSPKGRLVLALLKLAWARRLIFTIGVSSTTGESDTVVWNEIHHKTEMNSNISGHGYPDPNYLDNVIAELAAQGVTEDCLNM